MTRRSGGVEPTDNGRRRDDSDGQGLEEEEIIQNWPQAYQGPTRRDTGPRGRFVARSEAARFWEKVNHTASCWVWDSVTDRKGYGQFRAKRHGRWVYLKAHRWAYENARGPIPDALTLDHLCHTTDPQCPGGPHCPHRRCVNPDHLEPVSDGENRRRARQRRRHGT